jgi:hypothetical protein
MQNIYEPNRQKSQVNVLVLLRRHSLRRQYAEPRLYLSDFVRRNLCYDVKSNERGDATLPL